MLFLLKNCANSQNMLHSNMEEIRNFISGGVGINSIFMQKKIKSIKIEQSDWSRAFTHQSREFSHMVYAIYSKN